MLVIPSFLELLNDGFFAAIAAIGFASISNPARHTYWVAAVLAAAGHIVRFILLENGVILPFSTFVAGLVIGLICIPLSAAVRTPPATVSYPALLPMVPGKFAYGTIQSLLGCLMAGKDIDAFNHYFYLLNYNWMVCLFTIVLMVVGATIPIFTMRNHGMEVLRLMRQQLRLKRVANINIKPE